MNKLRQRLRWLGRSSTLRLSLLLSLIFAIGFSIAIFVALTLGERAIEQRVDATLAALAQTANVAEAGGDSRSMILRAQDDLEGLPQPFARAVARGGGNAELRNPLMRSETWRVLVANDSAGTPIMVAIPLEDSEEAQELLAGILWTTAAVVVALTLLIGLGAGLLAQRRVARISTTLNALETGDLTARTGQQKSKDDLDDIALQLDHTAGALERLVTQTRHLSASIAHDLRTPLARLRAQLEMLPDGDQRGAALEEASRLSGIFDTIMRVARIEAAHGNDGFASVNLAALAADLHETFEAVAEDEGKVLTVDVINPATIQADRQMLVQAMANLIQNALVHGGRDITLFAQGTTLGVADNGAGVDPSDYDEILKPMVRLDAARTTDGSGLGLALVRAVAERHNARLALEPNRPKGLRISLDFAEL